MRPPPVRTALAFAEQLRSHPNSVAIAPGKRHRGIFLDLCKQAGAWGNLVADAYFAALPVEWGSEWVTTDHGFARCPELRWRHPVD